MTESEAMELCLADFFAPTAKTPWFRRAVLHGWKRAAVVEKCTSRTFWVATGAEDAVL